MILENGLLQVKCSDPGKFRLVYKKACIIARSPDRI